MDIVKFFSLLSFNSMHLQKKPAVTALLLATFLSACGGGSGSSGGSSTPWKQGVYADASNFANKCESPRSGRSPVTDIDYPDKRGDTRDENNFLRSWSNDTYLWYNEIVDRNPANYNDPLAYFDLLKTTAKTNTGADKDKYHFTWNTDEYEALSLAGVSYGYGMVFSFGSMVPPRELTVVYTEPGSPAALANIPRGTQIIAVDQVDFVNDDTNSGITTINNGIFPSSANQAHTFTIQKPGASGTESVVLQSASITSTPVQNVKTFDTDSGKVGYLLFNDHIATAEEGLVDAITELQGESISDLIVDLRYNSGGYLAIASQFAYMVAGEDATEDETFEEIFFNDKHPTRDPVTGEVLEPIPFYNIGLDFSVAFGMALPSLNLPRVFVLTGNDTCSASEAFMNSLRGIGVDVIQIGNSTCGKPYGFYPQDNCGTTYFTVQFRGVNAEGYGDYSDGFIPGVTDNGMERIRGCLVEDDLLHALGDPDEARLAAALYFRENDACPAAVTSLMTSSMKMSASPFRDGVTAKHPALKTAWKRK
jgi:carboxyl-terminal processing protease